MQHLWWRRPFLKRKCEKEKAHVFSIASMCCFVCMLTIVALGLLSELGHVDIVFTFLMNHRNVTLRSIRWSSRKQALTVDIFRLSRFCKKNKKREKKERKREKEMRGKAKKIYNKTSELKAWIKSRSSLQIRHLYCFYHYSYQKGHKNTNANQHITRKYHVLDDTDFAHWKTPCKMIISCKI